MDKILDYKAGPDDLPDILWTKAYENDPPAFGDVNAKVSGRKAVCRKSNNSVKKQVLQLSLPSTPPAPNPNVMNPLQQQMQSAMLQMMQGPMMQVMMQCMQNMQSGMQNMGSGMQMGPGMPQFGGCGGASSGSGQPQRRKSQKQLAGIMDAADDSKPAEPIEDHTEGSDAESDLPQQADPTPPTDHVAAMLQAMQAAKVVKATAAAAAGATAKAKAKGKAKGKAEAKPKANAKANGDGDGKGKDKPNAKAKPDSSKGKHHKGTAIANTKKRPAASAQLGCKSCRGSPGGCKSCRSPDFTGWRGTRAEYLAAGGTDSKK